MRNFQCSFFLEFRNLSKLKITSLKIFSRVIFKENFQKCAWIAKKKNIEGFWEKVYAKNNLMFPKGDQSRVGLCFCIKNRYLGKIKELWIESPDCFENYELWIWSLQKVVGISRTSLAYLVKSSKSFDSAVNSGSCPNFCICISF